MRNPGEGAGIDTGLIRYEGWGGAVATSTDNV